MAKKETDIIITRWQIFGAITVALIGLGGTYLAAKSSGDKADAKTTVQILVPGVVPEVNPSVVSQLPSSETLDNYSVLKDISIYDLRSWRETPDSIKGKKRYSPVNYINYLHIKKLKAVDKFTAHYSTAGYAIDMRCITHRASIFKAEKAGEHDGQARYAVEVDISDVPLNDEFLIVIESTLWNSFTNLSLEDASTYTDKEILGLKELSVIIFLPESKPFKSYELRRTLTNKEEELFIRNIGTVFPDESRRFIYWSVGNITADTHYKIKWT